MDALACLHVCLEYNKEAEISYSVISCPSPFSVAPLSRRLSLRRRR